MIHLKNISNPDTIKNIIFDFGGVILPIDYSLTQKAFMKLGLKDASKTLTQLFQQYEKGLLTTNDFLSRLSLFLPDTVEKQQIIDAWNALILDYVPHKLELVKKLKEQYRVVLLSNTNELHFIDFTQKLKRQTTYNCLNEILHQTYYSHHLHMRKPDAEIFEKVLHLEGFKPEETLYFEDTAEHVHTAVSLGIQAKLITTQAPIEHYFVQ